MTGRVLLAAAWQPELRHWQAALARAPELARRAVARAVGVGLVEAALGAARAIAEEQPSAVVFVGTAGAYPAVARRLAVGEAACVRRVFLMSHAVLREDGYFPRPLPTELVTDPALRDAISAASALSWADLACPLAITTSPALARRAARGGQRTLENLEGFAVGRAAAAAALPFAAVVGVSNAVGKDAHQEWRRWAAPAAAAACAAVIAWLGADLRAPTRRRTAPRSDRPRAPVRTGRRSPA
jgi:nucleoside phosphorylase